MSFSAGRSSILETQRDNPFETEWFWELKLALFLVEQLRMRMDSIQGEWQYIMNYEPEVQFPKNWMTKTRISESS